MLMRDEMAGISRRVMGVVIDLIMLELAMVPLALGLREVTPSPVAVRLLELAVALVYSTIFLSGRGQTPGKIMATLRVIGADGGRLTPRQAFVRSLLKWLPVFVPMIALASMVRMPTNVHDAAVPGPELVAPSGPLASAIPLLSLALWFILIVSTRRHPDGQAPHDRVAGTYVVRLS